MRSRLEWPSAAAVLAVACGGSSAPGPVSVAAPSGTNSVSGLVFYDQDDDGVLDPDEPERLPDVRVGVGGQVGASSNADGTSIGNLPDGALAISIQQDSLPPYFRPGRLPALTLPLPTGTVVPVPVTLPSGANRPNTYLAFGDSITEGTGSTRREGRVAPLRERFRSHWGDADVIPDGVRSSNSAEGVARLESALAVRPACLLVRAGTNGWKKGCQSVAPPDCYTVTALRDMIRVARAAGTHPSSAPSSRHTRIRLDPVHGAAGRRPCSRKRGLPSAASRRPGRPFYDDLHPNDEGHARIGAAFSDAITRSRVRP